MSGAATIRCAGVGLAALTAATLGCSPSRAKLGNDLLWISTFEDGNFGEWSDPGGGGPRSDTAPNALEVSTEHAHRGRYAAKFTIATTMMDVQANTNLVRKSGLPVQAYYSAWYFVPNVVTVGTFWTIFKLRVRSVADDVNTEAELYDANIRSQGNGEMAFSIFDHRIRGEIPEQLPNVAVPVGRWFQVEAFYRNAQDDTGHATFWFDGRLVADIGGRPMGPTPWVEWNTCNVGVNLSPSPVTLYVDDAAISGTRVGPDGILEE